MTKLRGSDYRGRDRQRQDGSGAMCWRHVDTQLQIQDIAETVGKAVECTVCGGQVPPSAAPFQESQPLRMYLLYLDGSGS
ncbi:MAG: hypothetical protein OXU81_00775, partial [Gammaproteobacteria bacterium]|nr:hypothetical protein [Gammaproteobacteria bacterium]